MVLTNLPVVSVDVGDVPDVLEGVTPSAWVPWPPDGGTASARAQLVTALADELEKVLVTRQRSNGREVNQRILLDGAARAVEAVYRRALGEHHRP